MNNQYPDLSGLVELIQFRDKRHLTRYVRNLTVTQQELAFFVLAAQRGIFSPYKYANHFFQTTPDHLYPNDKEQQAFSENGEGHFKSKASQKFASKIFQLARERRSTSAHLLYTPDYRFWHLIYFDSHDLRRHSNHWRFGPHIHYVGDLWPELSLESVWEQVLSGRVSLPSKAHIRYKVGSLIAGNAPCT